MQKTIPSLIPVTLIVTNVDIRVKPLRLYLLCKKEKVFARLQFGVY